MIEVVNEIYEKKLSVRQTEKLVYEIKNDVNYEKEEAFLNKKFKCQSNVLKKRITLTFPTEKAKKKFLEKIKEDLKQLYNTIQIGVFGYEKNKDYLHDWTSSKLKRKTRQTYQMWNELCEI